MPRYCHLSKLCHKCSNNITAVESNPLGICSECKDTLRCFPVCLKQPSMAYGKTWVYYDKNWDMKHKDLYNSTTMYCRECFPANDRDTTLTKTFLCASHQSNSFLSVLPLGVRGIVASFIIPSGPPCRVCLRTNVLMYAQPPRYGFDHLCLECNSIIEDWYCTKITEERIAKKVHNRQAIPRILKVVNSRITQSNYRVARKATGSSSLKRKLQQKIADMYYTKRVCEEPMETTVVL
jgi:hypothetical protein